MDAFEVVREETRRMRRGCIPLALFAYAVFALFGYYQWGVALSLALGTAYTLFNFYQMACTAVRAALLGDPVRARRMQSSRYFVRYVLTGALLVAVIKCPPLNAVAAAVPLFFPKILLVASGVFQRKGG
ncbi:ATP synthase subunit I [Intestinibacillus sp. Marseille-P6563]|uniref:ATP synthase subunit I n=1 Tax=Intestinibacillus sp. Marseille-P6563 TaxID=2364792 RepID=UPI000F056000|nr:ATP synthase subunit I [Intestinibacillus sp. Marseille-P6563]